jgi:hypothetical protein
VVLNLEAIKYLESDDYFYGRVGSGMNLHVGAMYNFRDDNCWEENLKTGTHHECPVDSFMKFRDDNEAYADAYVRGEVWEYLISIEQDF